MKNNRFITVPGEGWLSRSAAKCAYRLSAKEINLICRELKDSGAWCPRKGLAIGALDQVVKRLRGQS